MIRINAHGMSARKVKFINNLRKRSTEPLDQDDIDMLASMDESTLERMCFMSPEEMDECTEAMKQEGEEYEELLRLLRAVDEQVKKIADRRQQKDKSLHNAHHRDAGTSGRKLLRWPVRWKPVNWKLRW